MPNQTVRNPGLSNGKSICVILAVIGCFSVLWPKVFYPMLMTGIHLSTNTQQKSNNDVDFQMLPPKVREAIKKSPTKDAGSPVHRLPGRPQFYAGRDRSTQNQSGSSGGMWNIMVPVYTIIIVIFFLYFVLKLAFSGENAQDIAQEVPPLMHDVDQCHECQYQYEEIKRNKNRFDPYTTRPSYKAFNSYGRQNVSRCLHNLIQDMQVFRKQLLQGCNCKMNIHEEINKKEHENEIQVTDVKDKILTNGKKDTLTPEKLNNITTDEEKEVLNQIDFNQEENLTKKIDKGKVASQTDINYDDEAEPEGENYFLAKGKAVMEAQEEYLEQDKENAIEEPVNESTILCTKSSLYKRKGAQRRRKRNKNNKAKNLDNEVKTVESQSNRVDNKVLKGVNKKSNKKQLKND